MGARDSFQSSKKLVTSLLFDRCVIAVTYVRTYNTLSAKKRLA